MQVNAVPALVLLLCHTAVQLQDCVRACVRRTGSCCRFASWPYRAYASMRVWPPRPCLLSPRSVFLALSKFPCASPRAASRALTKMEHKIPVPKLCTHRRQK